MNEVVNVSITIKEGYRMKFVGGHMLLVHPEWPCYLIDLRSVAPGDCLPRETDKPVEWDIDVIRS
jgi:hypothetical protein